MRNDMSVLFCAVSLILPGIVLTSLLFEADLLKEQLLYHEIVQVERSVEKEGNGGSVTARYSRVERLSFHAFKRFFVVYLTRKQGTLHRYVIAREVLAGGKEQLININPDEHYEGHVFGTNDSAVSLTFDDHGTPLGIIQYEQEVFALEPARLHLRNAKNTDVLIYRTSDMKKRYFAKTPKFCSTMDPPINSSGAETSSRSKRSFEVVGESKEVVVKNRCSLRVVADYSFYKAIGGGNVAFTSRYLINVIDRINTLFTSVDWGHDRDGRRMVNMGFIIKDMKIHTATTSEWDHYNAYKPGDRVDVNVLLDQFSRAEGTNSYCLVHLFTAHSFANNVLGLAYISSPEPLPPGGICSPASSFYGGTSYSHNTALSSARTMQGGVVVSREADLVTAHELGHNWGATHDDQQLDCSPSYKQGGAYLMSVFSVSGYDKNNYKFSPCSKLMIGKVLARKSYKCFEEEKSSFCGNGRVERGPGGVLEECDIGGKLWGEGEDRCCHANCTLKVGMQCSPKNSPCCSNDCRFLGSDHICLHKNSLQCRSFSNCTGESGECPEPMPIDDGEKCLDEGECRNGTCMSFCESRGMEPCICPEVKDSCYRCCRSFEEGKKCSRIVNASKLSDGSRCIQGHCLEGVCKREIADGVLHLWIYFQTYDRGNFVKFFKDNLVGIIALVMLIIWIPVSCAFHRYDQIRAEQSMVDNVEFIPEKKEYSPMNSSTC